MKVNADFIGEAKKKAALEAVSHVKDGFIVGLGSGSTAAFAIEALGERIKKEQLKIMGIPSSYQAFQLSVEHGVPVTTLDEHPVIDLAIDGADQVTPQLWLIKGMGAALLREKIVAAASKCNIIIVDETKKVKVLGEKNQPVPVEVLPFGISLAKRKIKELGGKPILREGKGKLGAIITDNGNVIIDAEFGLIENPEKLDQKLHTIPSVIETGLFYGLTDMVFVASASGIETLRRN